MDDSLYTGVDKVEGIFGNEAIEASTKEVLDEQKKQLQELTPKLRDIVEMLDKEIALVMSVDRFVGATTTPIEDIRAELQASALYKGYLVNLKTKFKEALRESINGKR